MMTNNTTLPSILANRFYASYIPIELYQEVIETFSSEDQGTVQSLLTTLLDINIIQNIHEFVDEPVAKENFINDLKTHSLNDSSLIKLINNNPELLSIIQESIERTLLASQSIISQDSR